jgi:hypothetical protein
MSENKNVPIITKSDLTKSENNMLTTNQLSFLLQKTPKNHIYSRPAKGGGTWNYVTGTYIKKVLNLMFGWDWSFEIVEHKFDIHIGQAYVLGKLTVNSNGRSIVKMQFGRVDIKFKRDLAFNPDGTPKMAKNRSGQEYQVKEPGDKPLDLGNDLKAASTDALKKCAAELGIASDVYAPEEFKEIKIVDEKPKTTPEEERIETLLNDVKNQDDLDFIKGLKEAQTEKYLSEIKGIQQRLNKENKTN